MRKFGAFSFKRTWCWSLNVVVGELNLGTLTKRQRKNCKATVKYSKSTNGKKKYTGNQNLKKTQ